jgi:hypothetical protein
VRCKHNKVHVLLSMLWSRRRTLDGFKSMFAPKQDGATDGARPFLYQCDLLIPEFLPHPLPA